LGKQDEGSKDSTNEYNINYEKGILGEELFGVIYLEYYFEEIGRVIAYLQ
jgi:hypothetical protein